MMPFLGMTNFCTSWISNYAQVTASLKHSIYDKRLAVSDPLTWTAEADKLFVDIK